MTGEHRFQRVVLLAIWTLAVLVTASYALAGESKVVDDFLDKSRAMMAGEKPKIRPGDWVSYRMITSPGAKAGFVRIESLIKISSPLHVDTEHPLEPGQYWLEFEMADPTGQSETAFTMKMLVSGDPREPRAIKRMFIKASNRLPMELTSKWLDKGAEKKSSACERIDAQGCAARGGKIRKYKEKHIYTKLGVMKARRVLIEMPDGRVIREYWFCDKVPMFGFAKASIEDRIELRLEGYGQGALSRIDETRAVPMPDPEELEKQLSGHEH